MIMRWTLIKNSIAAELINNIEAEMILFMQARLLNPVNCIFDFLKIIGVLSWVITQ